MPPDYSQWALSCLMRELAKQFPALPHDLPLSYGDLVNDDALLDRIKGSARRIVAMLKHTYGCRNHPIANELKRRFDLP